MRFSIRNYLFDERRLKVAAGLDNDLHRLAETDDQRLS
jgi:hypothetical protein